MRKYEEELYPFWRLPKFVDVTREYAYYYKSFYNEALRHFECELSDY